MRTGHLSDDTRRRECSREVRKLCMLVRSVSGGLYTLLCRRCYKGIWAVTSSFAVPNGACKCYSAFRQKFPKLWTSVAHSFLQQIAQNKNWAHPKATTLPRICKVEMQQASLLYYSAKPQSGGILGCALVCPTSLYVRTIRFPDVLSKLAERRSVLTVPCVVRLPSVPMFRALIMIASVHRHGRVALRSEYTVLVFLPFVWFFRHVNMQPPLSTSSTKRPLMWPTFLDQKHFVITFNDPKPAGYATPKTETTPLN